MPVRTRTQGNKWGTERPKPFSLPSRCTVVYEGLIRRPSAGYWNQSVSARSMLRGSWLAVRLQAADQRPEHGRRWRQALAVDGKAVQGPRHASSDGQAVHLLAVIDQQASAVLAQASVDDKTNEITPFAPLLEPCAWTSA